MEENLPPPKGGDPWWQYVLWAALAGLGIGPVIRDHIKAVLRRREKRISAADELIQSLRHRIDHLEAEVKDLRARLSECE
jgi:cell division protein FtsB